ncbi:MAG: hypothetical protein WKF50_13430, partial [Nocardioides sp.]
RQVAACPTVKVNHRRSRTAGKADMGVLGEVGVGRGRLVPSRRGYMMARFYRDHLRADFQTLPYVQKRGAPAATAASFVVEDGNPGLVRG